jgi:hypothetical protein
MKAELKDGLMGFSGALVAFWVISWYVLVHDYRHVEIARL